MYLNHLADPGSRSGQITVLEVLWNYYLIHSLDENSKLMHCICGHLQASAPVGQPVAPNDLPTRDDQPWSGSVPVPVEVEPATGSELSEGTPVPGMYASPAVFQDSSWYFRPELFHLLFHSLILFLFNCQGFGDSSPWMQNICFSQEFLF